VIGAVVLTRTLARDELLDDLQPASMELPPVAPEEAGASDESSS